MRALAALVLGAAPAAQDLRVRGPEPDPVLLGGEALVTLSISGAPGDAALGPLPEVDGLEIRAGSTQPADDPSSEDSGAAWQIALAPQREGVFEVPPLSVSIAGRTLNTAPIRVRAVRDVDGAQHAFLELATERAAYFVGEPIRLSLRVGFDARFFAESAVPLFRREIDLPLQIRAPWLDELEGALALPVEELGDERERRSLALGDRVVEARRVADRALGARSFTVLEIERRYAATAPGELAIPGALARFAYATRFDDDLVRGRVPADRREAFAYADGLALQIRPLPAEGRPRAFTGAVGRYSVSAEASPPALDVGQSFALALRIEGEGNLFGFDPPALDELERFHVYGRIEERSATQRTITYDLAPLDAGVQAVPPIPFAFFDPGPPSGYRTVLTEPIALEVRARADASIPPSPPSAEGARSVPNADDPFDLEPVPASSADDPPHRIPTALLAAALIAPWLIALGLLALRRARQRERGEPLRARARDAARAFRASQPAGDDALSRAFADYLAARLARPPPAVIAPDLASELAAAGAPSELAQRAAALLERLTEARYGGPACADGEATARALVDALERSFDGAERRP